MYFRKSSLMQHNPHLVEISYEWMIDEAIPTVWYSVLSLEFVEEIIFL